MLQPNPADLTAAPHRPTRVCLALGPYRNLTTLTAGILSLHPSCQVLNHAGVRLLPDPELNFLANYSHERFEAFTRQALVLSAGGERGQRGGAITKSHAFDPEHPLGRLYRARYGSRELKERPSCLFWKESLHVTNFLRGHRVDVAALLEANEALSFLLPIRNPLDCALSNVRTQHTRYFAGLPAHAELPEVLTAVLDHLRWAADLRAAHPGRVFLFSELEFGRGTLLELASFLALEPEQRWIEDALAAYELKPGYEHPVEHRALFEALVSRGFGPHPELAEQLLRFL